MFTEKQVKNEGLSTATHIFMRRDNIKCLLAKFACNDDEQKRTWTEAYPCVLNEPTCMLPIASPETYVTYANAAIYSDGKSPRFNPAQCALLLIDHHVGTIQLI